MASKCGLGSEAGRPPLIEVAPGIYINPVIRVEMARASSLLLLDKRGLAQIGLTPSQFKSLRRLYEAGYIKMFCVTPRVAMLDVETWQRHIARVAGDPWFWEREGEHLARYRGTYRR